MTDPPFPDRRRPRIIVFTGFALALAAGAWAGARALSGPGSLRAAGPPIPDWDADGLSNGFEGIFGTDPVEIDSDFDGWSDAEELARGTDPLIATDVPFGSAISVGLDASAHDAFLHLVSTFYLPDSADLVGLDWNLGVMLPGRGIFFLPQGWTVYNSTISFLPAADPQAVLMTVDTRVRQELVLSFGSASFANTVSINGQIVAAEAIDVLSLDGALVRRIELDDAAGSWSTGPGPGQAAAGQKGPWTLYVPLGDEGIPSNWIPGSVCLQETQIIGAVGASVTQEVVSADCQDGWDGYCSSDCPNTIGETHTTIDPGALIGG